MGSYNASEHCNMPYNEYMYCNLGSYESLTRQCGSFSDFCKSIDSCQSDSMLEERYSAPVVYIGIYISAASFVCILAMALDLVSGIRNRKFWIPTKYFSLNALSITVISVAMKLPLDLTSPMPGKINQLAKSGSLGFMCTIISNLMPSLASMDNKSLLANVASLSILVITIAVNVGIQRSWTRVLDSIGLFVGLLLLLLIFFISFAITLPTSKNILESKYQDKIKTLFNDQNPQQNSTSNVEELRKVVKRYWTMVESGSPQFVMSGNILSAASAAVCVYNMMLQVMLTWLICVKPRTFSLSKQEKSVYKESVFGIVIIQTIGTIVGSIAPMFRCFTILRFDINVDRFKEDESPFFMSRIQSNWTKKFIEWKESRISSLSSSRRSRVLLHNLENLLLSLCIIFQKVTSYMCIACSFFPYIFIRLAFCCPNLISSTLETSDDDEELNNYVLLLQDDIPLAKRAMNRISHSMNLLVKKAEKKQHNNLLNFLNQSVGFEGVASFDTDQVPSLPYFEYVNSWSLPVISLTCIAIALPNIQKDIVDNLVESVGEGLLYTHLVEESLNKAPEYVNVRRATMTVWHEVESKRKWLKNTLERSAYRGQTPIEIINLFVERAEVSDRSILREPDLANPKLIAANSMYRIAKTIMHTFYSNGSALTENALFTRLCEMIADILAACLTNIPRVILMKCHESAIEKREASVLAAVNLFGRTSEIIKKLETRVKPNMDHDKMGFIDEWHHYLKQP